jgi:DNA polymerase-1
MTFGKGSHLHLIDGSAFIFRAYHALPPLTRKSDGLPVGAVAGFCNMLYRYIEANTGSDAPTHAAVIFDYSGKTFRNDLFPAYKANRPPAPEELVPQFPLTREATRAFNVSCIEIEGFEADDIIGTLSCQAREAGGRVTIISSDKDLMQLIGGGVEMLDPMKNKRIDREGVEEKFGVGPERVVDVQALAGDSVDNVPGAPGIGIKTAALLINEYGDLDTLLARAEEIKQPKRRQALIDNVDQIRVSRDLVKLDCDMVLDFSLDSLEVQTPKLDDLLAFLAKMEFRTIVKRVSERFGVEAPAIPDVPAPAAAMSEAPSAPKPVPFDTETYEKVSTMGALERWIDAIYARGYVAVDTETTSLDEMQAELVGISLCVEPGTACYIPLGHTIGEDDLFGGSNLVDGQLAKSMVLDTLKVKLPALPRAHKGPHKTSPEASEQDENTSFKKRK